MNDRYSRHLKQVLNLAAESTGSKTPADLTVYALLHAITKVSEGEAAQALAGISVDVEVLRNEVEGLIQSVEAVPAGKTVLERAEKEAGLHHDREVGSEHLLLALTEENMGEFGHLLAKHGITWAAVNRAVTDGKRWRKDNPTQTPVTAAQAKDEEFATITLMSTRANANKPVEVSTPHEPVPAPAAPATPTPRTPAAAPRAPTLPPPPAAVSTPPTPPTPSQTPAPAPVVPSPLISHKAAEPVGAYPHARRVGNLLFLAGIGPRKRGQKIIPGVTLDMHGEVVAHDIEAQVRSCFENVRTILEEFGSSWDRIVDVTVFLTDMKGDFATFNRLWSDYFQSNQPTRTTVEVNGLPTPIAFEVKVIATV